MGALKVKDGLIQSGQIYQSTQSTKRLVPSRAPGEYWLPWAELLRRTLGVDPEICACGARMIVDDAITDGEKITERVESQQLLPWSCPIVPNLPRTIPRKVLLQPMVNITFDTRT